MQVQRLIASALAVLLLSLSAGTADAAPSGLVPSDVAATKVRSDGLQASVSFKVTNRGERAQRPRRARVRMSLGGDSFRLGNVLLPRLAPGKSASRSLTHAIPDAAGAGSYDVEVCVRSTQLPRCASGEQPILIEPTTLQASVTAESFADTLVGATSAAKAVTFTNAGDVPASSVQLATAGANAGDFEIAGNACGGQLRAGASCTAQVDFAPSAAGARAGRLVASGGGSEAGVELSGKGLEPAALSISPADHDFGTVATNDSEQAAFAVTNDGDVPSGTLAAPSLGGTDPGQFSVASDTCSGSALAPGATCTVEVDFEPSATGAKSATVTVSGTPGGNAKADLSGTGANPATLLVTPSTRDFGNVTVGANSSVRSFTVDNTGGVTSHPITVSITGTNADQFAATGTDTCSGQTLAPGAQCTISARFSPTSSGYKEAKFDATASGAGGTGGSTIYGQGQTPANLTITPTSKDFGNVLAGTTSATQTFTVTNTGQATVDALAYSSVGSIGQFPRSDDTCTGSSLAGGASCSFKFAFAPAGTGARTMSSQVVAVGTQANFTLAGTGVATAASLAWDPPTRNYAAIPAEGDLAAPVYLRNDGAADAHSLDFHAGTPTSGNVTNVHFTPASVAGNQPCGSDLAAGAVCTGFLRFHATAVTPTSVSLEVTGTPGGSVTFTATYG
ncbi:MAG: choice-of-anchor D domain-containing protein [Solirubrobacterales bacterium]